MTTYIYTENIPDTPNDPADDQPNMKINTNSVAGILSEDHIPFVGNSTNGRHKKITFNDVASPAAPANPVSILYTAVNAAAKSWPFFRNSEDIFSVMPDPTNTGTNFGFKLGKIIVNYGSIAFAGVSTMTVTLDIQCTAVESLIAMGKDTTFGTIVVSAAPVGAGPFTQITVTLRASIGSGTVYYLLIGS